MSKFSMMLPIAALAIVAASPAEAGRARPTAKPVAAKVSPKRAAKNVAAATPEVSMVAPAAVAADPANKLILDLSNGGHVVVQLRPDVAPASVHRIQALAQQHFYDGLKFHRGPKQKIPFLLASSKAGFITSISSLPTRPSSPVWGFKPSTAILGLLIPKSFLRESFMILSLLKIFSLVINCATSLIATCSVSNATFILSATIIIATSFTSKRFFK